MAGIADLLWQQNVRPAPQRNDSNASRFIVDALMEAGGKLGAAPAGIAQALMAPGNALRGEYDQVGIMGDGSVTMADPRMYDDATELSGLVGLGAMPMPRPSNSLGMFGGMNAKTADLDALKRAQSLEATGAPREAIWNDTGWFKGADGQWRFEIDDSSGVFFKGDGNAKELAERWGGTAGNTFRHNRLYAAYPELADMGLSGSSRMSSMGTYYRPDLLDTDGAGQVKLNTRLQGDNLKSTMLHELQHAVQQQEGWQGGGNSSQFASDIPNPAVGVYRNALASSPELQELAALRGSGQLDAEIRKANDLWRAEYQAKADALEEMDTPEALAQLDALFQSYNERQRQLFPAIARSEDLAVALKGHGIPHSPPPEMLRPAEAYRSLPGEVEARNVQTRMNMTPEQRKAQAPWLTQDVPDNQQIIRMLFGN